MRLMSSIARRTGAGALCLGLILTTATWAVEPTARPEAEPAARPTSQRAELRRRPNILLILVDTLRADRLGCYGHPDKLTPAMDSLAEEGVLFERVISACPWTLPSVATCFTGVYPTAHGVNGSRNMPGATKKTPRRIFALPESFTTLAEALRQAGYATAGFSANPYIRRSHGFAQGFIEFNERFARNTTPGAVLNKAALAWLDQRRNREPPFFLYLHYMDVHGPYITAAWKYVEAQVDAVRQLSEPTPIETFTPLLQRCMTRYRKLPDHRELFKTAEYWAALYTAGVPQMDDYLAEFREQLRRRKLWDDTYVILVADHGEALYENGIWGHGLSAHQNQLHVPLILRWPGVLPAGKRVPDTVSLVDFMPTLLDQLDIDPPAGLQGISLAPAIAGERLEERPLLAEAVKIAPYRKALVEGKWKLLGSIDTDEFELFDNAVDPWDQHDVAAEHPDRVRDMRRELAALLEQNQQVKAAVTHHDVQLSDEDEARLRALGYIEDEDPNSPSGSEAPAEMPATPGNNK